MGRRGEHTPQVIPGDRADGFGFPRLVEDWLTDLAARGFAEATIRSRRQALAQLAGWLTERGVGRPVEVTRPMLVRYQRFLFHYRKPDGQPLSFRSQNTRLTPVRAFFTWAVRNEYLAANPASELELPRVEQRLPKPALTVEEAERVLAVPDTGTVSGLRDRCVLEVFYGTGVRRAELARLNVRDLDAERGTLLVRQGKGKKDRLVPIGDRAIAWVRRYLIDARPHLLTGATTGAGPGGRSGAATGAGVGGLLDGGADDGTLFLTLDGTAFSLDRLTQLVREHVKASGVGKEGACHLFRHTLATLMLEGGADIRYIQAMLGHAELSTTQIYTQVSIRALQAVHSATFPAATTATTPRSQAAQAGGAVPGTAPADDPMNRTSEPGGGEDAGERFTRTAPGHHGPTTVGGGLVEGLRVSPAALLAALADEDDESDDDPDAHRDGDPVGLLDDAHHGDGRHEVDAPDDVGGGLVLGVQGEEFKNRGHTGSPAVDRPALGSAAGGDRR